MNFLIINKFPKFEKRQSTISNIPFNYIYTLIKFLEC